MTTPIEHVTAATSAIRSATAAVGRTLPEIETLEEYIACEALVQVAVQELIDIQEAMLDHIDGPYPGYPIEAADG